MWCVSRTLLLLLPPPSLLLVLLLVLDCEGLNLNATVLYPAALLLPLPLLLLPVLPWLARESTSSVVAIIINCSRSGKYGSINNKRSARSISLGTPSMQHQQSWWSSLSLAVQIDEVGNNKLFWNNCNSVEPVNSKIANNVCNPNQDNVLCQSTFFNCAI